MSAKEARMARDSAKAKKSDGADPVQVRKLDRLKNTRTSGDTFKAIALEWYAKQALQWSDTNNFVLTQQLCT